MRGTVASWPIDGKNYKRAQYPPCSARLRDRQVRVLRVSRETQKFLICVRKIVCLFCTIVSQFLRRNSTK